MNDKSDPEAAALIQAHPGWFIARAMFGGWQATWKSESGLSIHYVYGTSVEDLGQRLRVIEEARA